MNRLRNLLEINESFEEGSWSQYASNLGGTSYP